MKSDAKNSEQLTEIVAAEFVAGAASPAQLPPPVQLEVAFAGRSNVGKSSLLNRLMGRHNLARTSSTPGCTRQIQFYSVRTRDDMRLLLVDLPGYGYAQRSRSERKAWADLIERYLLERPTLKTVVLLVDARRGLGSDEENLLKMVEERTPARPRPPEILIVLTKLDKLPRSGQARAVEASDTKGRTLLGFSTEWPKSSRDLWFSIRSSLNAK